MAKTNEQLVIEIQAKETNTKELYNQLWEQTEPLIKRIIVAFMYNREYRNGVEPEDLLQCGYFALVLAVKYYDANKPYKFNTYLSRCIKHEINKALGISNGKAKKEPLSLYDEVSNREETESTYIDLITDNSAFEEIERVELSELQQAVQRALCCLTAEEREVIQLIYFKELNKKQIADKIGKTETQVRNIQSKALNKLRKPLIRRTLEEYIKKDECYFYSTCYNTELLAIRNIMYEQKYDYFETQNKSRTQPIYA